MNNHSFSYRVNHVDAKAIMDHHLRELEGYDRCTINLHKSVIASLLSGCGCKSLYLDCTERVLLTWMIADAKGKSNNYAASRLQVVDRYIKLICKHGLLPDNPIRRIKPKDADPSWNYVVEILQSAKPWQKLCQLNHNKRKPGPLAKHIQKYIDLQQSLGKKYTTHSHILCHLDSFLVDNGVNKLVAIKPEHIQRWLNSMQSSKRLKLVYLRIVKRYMDYLLAISLIENNIASALITEFGRVPASKFKPFIFTKSQIKSLLRYAKQLPPNHLFRLRPQVCYTMLVLFYSLGLRNSEVRGLRFSNVDMDKCILHIEGTKFHKSRIVPFGPRVQKCLAAYITVRSQMFLPIKPDDPLFITYRRHPIGISILSSLLKKLVQHLCPQPSPSPRIHDFRHTFAVHRLLRWYREGADVQLKLPLLSVFMGHTEITSTEVYLTITTDLLKEANNRFYQHCGKEMHI